MYVLGNWVKFPAGEVDLGRWAALEGKSPPPPMGVNSLVNVPWEEIQLAWGHLCNYRKICKNNPPLSPYIKSSWG